jgi:hypothetical protein
MKRIGWVALVVLALLVVAGCSGPKAASTSGGPSGGSGAAPSTADQNGTLDAFPQVVPASPNEKAVAGKTDAYLASYVKYNTPNATAQNPLYTPPAGQKAQFIGYAVTAYSPKDAKGEYGATQIVVTGSHVQQFGTSQLIPDLAVGQNVAIDKLLKRRSTYDAKQSDVKRTPVSAGEKNAVEVAKAWVSKNLASAGYSPNDVAITGYVLFWGTKPSANKSLYLLVQPDSDLVAAAWSG